MQTENENRNRNSIVEFAYMLFMGIGGFMLQMKHFLLLMGN